jgi:hypothetical protein
MTSGALCRLLSAPWAACRGKPDALRRTCGESKLSKAAISRRLHLLELGESAGDRGWRSIGRQRAHHDQPLDCAKKRMRSSPTPLSIALTAPPACSIAGPPMSAIADLLEAALPQGPSALRGGQAGGDALALALHCEQVGGSLRVWEERGFVQRRRRQARAGPPSPTSTALQASWCATATPRSTARAARCAATRCRPTGTASTACGRGTIGGGCTLGLRVPALVCHRCTWEGGTSLLAHTLTRLL